jgi:tetratricopeptide (TPR) repeat protein
MAMDGLILFTCAVLTAVPAGAPEQARSPAVENTLAVQTAFQKGRDLLLKGDAQSAARVLEAQLPRINGNRAYLMLLRDAYRECVKELSLKNRPAEAKKYFERLCILDPSAGTKAAPPGGSSPPSRASTDAARPEVEVSPRQAPVFRGKRDEDPFDIDNRDRPREAEGPDRVSEAARRLIDEAAAQFRKRHYTAARALYERAHRADPKSTEAVRDRWAYCKLHYVVEQLNRPRSEVLAWAGLEQEVKDARTMAPRLGGTARWLLRELDERRNSLGARAGDDGPAPAAIPVRHGGRNAQGWYVAETANFRIFHNQPRDVVGRAARVVEETRAAMGRKWFGQAGAAWDPRCDVYLHADGKEYSRVTGVPANSPGHSRIETDAGRVVSRRIDVRCDNPDVLAAVLPHETTHVVLAGHFGKHQVPRWADEGMAVLTEPRDKLARHRRNLERSREDGQLFDVAELMKLGDYPAPRRISAFYAQSVSLVEFLARERGPEVFARFLREALEDGYEPALRKHYRFRGFADLQARWNRHAFGGAGEDYAARGQVR